MPIDLYTRIVLTTIALALVWLCIVLTPMGTPVRAQGNVQDVRIVGVKRPETRRVTEFGKPIRDVLLGDWDAVRTTE